MSFVDMHQESPSDLEKKGEIYTSGDTPIPSTVDLFEDGSVDPVYQAKARLINSALQEMGMGKYQVRVSSVRLLWTAVDDRPNMGSSGGCSRSLALDGSRTCISPFLNARCR